MFTHLLAVMDLKNNSTKPKNYNQKVTCSVCTKTMRDDNLQRHMKTHADINAMTEDDKRVELERRKEVCERREQQLQETRAIAIEIGAPPSCYEHSTQNSLVVHGDDLRTRLRNDKRVYDEKIELGHEIEAIIRDGDASEESLSKEDKNAFDLFQKQKMLVDISTVSLRAWQDKLLAKLQKSSDREVIWVCGVHGNEGKSFFQAYVESWLGYARVARLDLRNRPCDVLHALAKRPLASTDVFLFNLTRPADKNDVVSYAVIESIKDGYATTTKYNSTVIRFKTPNVVAVFANEYPDFSQLSLDRWTCLLIGDVGNITPVNAEHMREKQRNANTKKCKGFTEMYDASGKVTKRI